MKIHFCRNETKSEKAVVGQEHLPSIVLSARWDMKHVIIVPGRREVKVR